MPPNAHALVHHVHRVGGTLYAQATLGVASVNFCTVAFGSAFFNSFCCVPCVLPDTLVLRCMMFIFSVKAALLAKRRICGAFCLLVFRIGHQSPVGRFFIRSSSPPLPFTITCPKVTFPEVTTCIHKSSPCSVLSTMRFSLTKKGFISEPVDL